MSTRLQQIVVEHPCSQSWERMPGEGAKRFCDVCGKHVHNLSVMQPEQAESLLSGQPSLCVRYLLDRNGAIVTCENLRRPPGTRLIRDAATRSIRVALPLVAIAAGTAGCVQGAIAQHGSTTQEVVEVLGSPLPPATSQPAAER